MKIAHTISSSSAGRFTACLVALAASLPLHGQVLQVNGVDISTSASIVGEPGAPSALTIRRSASGGSTPLGPTGVGSIAQYDVPPIPISPGVVQTFPPVFGRATQTIGGINRVAIDAPADFLGGKVASIEARANWRVAIENAQQFPFPARDLNLGMDFIIFGGQLKIDCFNCLTEATTIEFGAEITFDDFDLGTVNTLLWEYRAALTATNPSLPPVLSLAGSNDPQGTGFPTTVLSGDSSRSEYIVDILPFSGRVDFVLSAVDPTGVITYNMFAKASGGITAFESRVSASLGDPFAFSGGSSGPTFLLNGQTIESLLAPIPEPRVYALMLLGLCVVGMARRRRTRRP